MLKTLFASASLAFAFLLLPMVSAGPNSSSVAAQSWEHKGSWVGSDSNDDGYDNSRVRISCRRGTAIVRNAGFDRVRARECNGEVYSYSGRKNGANFLIGVNSEGGKISSVRKARLTWRAQVRRA